MMTKIYIDFDEFQSNLEKAKNSVNDLKKSKVKQSDLSKTDTKPFKEMIDSITKLDSLVKQYLEIPDKDLKKLIQLKQLILIKIILWLGKWRGISLVKIQLEEVIQKHNDFQTKSKEVKRCLSSVRKP